MNLLYLLLLTALAAYVLFGGADFGGGLLEATLWRHKRLQEKLQATLAPVWEANHVWLIAVIVILFVGYPGAYTALTTHFFVPIHLALLAIILRGAFFTFRKYDPDPQGGKGLYTLLFRVSSGLAPTVFGLMVGGLLVPLPTLAQAEDLGFFGMYIRPWLHPIALFCAIFVNALFGYLASVFFWGEVDNAADRQRIQIRIFGFFTACFLSGGLVLFSGLFYHLVPPDKVLSFIQLEVQVLALGGIYWMWRALQAGKVWQVRFAAGMQTLAILAGWAHMRYPALMSFQDGSEITFASAAAPEITRQWLVTGLLIVLSVVLPLLVWLYRVFQKSMES